MRPRTFPFARILPLLVVAALASGCVLQLLLGRVVVATTSEEELVLQASIQSSASVAVCLPREDPFGFECTYIVDGEPITSTTELAGLGLFGVFVDPVVLQLPAEAFDVTGSYTGPGGGGPLAIQVGLATVPVDLDTQIAAEAGTQLVVVEFPAPTPPLPEDYDFQLHFRLPPDFGPVMVKAMFTGRVEADGEVFYPPLFPCVASFAGVPSLEIPQSPTFEPIDLSGAAGLEGCDGALYDYGTAPQVVAVPALSGGAAVAFALLLAAAAAWTLAPRC